MTRTIETLYLVRDTEHNKANYPAQVNGYFEFPIGMADCLNVPAETVLKSTDYIDLAHVDSMAEKHGFDTVRIAVYQDTPQFVFTRQGIPEFCFSLGTAIGFFKGLAYRNDNWNVETITLGINTKIEMPADVRQAIKAATSDVQLTEQSADDNPYDNTNRGEGAPMPRKPQPKQPNGPTNAARAPRQMAQRF